MSHFFHFSGEERVIGEDYSQGGPACLISVHTDERDTWGSVPTSQMLHKIRVGHVSSRSPSEGEVGTEQPMRCSKSEAGAAKPSPLLGQGSWTRAESTSLNHQHIRKEK